MADLKDLEVDLLTKIKTLAGFKFWDIWNDQFDEIAKGNTFGIPFPAIFIEIVNPTKWQQLGGGLRTADILLKIHVVTELLNAVTNGAAGGDGAISQNLPIFDTRAIVMRGMFMYKPIGSGNMFSEADYQDNKHTNMYHWISEWKFAFVEATGTYDDPVVFAANYQTIEAGVIDADITVDINNTETDK